MLFIYILLSSNLQNHFSTQTNDDGSMYPTLIIECFATIFLALFYQLPVKLPVVAVGVYICVCIGGMFEFGAIYAN